MAKRNPNPESADQERRARLVQGARRHFFAQGFRFVTMDDLATELGMSKRTFYAIFPSKRALLEAVLDSKFSDIKSDLQAITDHPPQTVQALLTSLVACLQHHVQELQPPLLRDLSRETPDLLERLHQRRAELVSHYFEQVLRNGQADGLIRTDVPAEVLIQILLGAIQRLVDSDTLSRLGLAPVDMFSFVMGVFMDGAASRQGRMS